MKSSFSAAGCEEVYKSLDHLLLHAVCCEAYFHYTVYTQQLDTCKRNQKVRPSYSLPLHWLINDHMKKGNGCVCGCVGVSFLLPPNAPLTDTHVKCTYA